MSVSSIEEAIEDIRQGKMVILVDDEDRENEGDLTLAAEAATPENINFMAKYGRGLICLTLTPDKCDALGLRPMVRDNTSPFEHRLHRFHRGKKRGHHRHLGRRSRPHHPHRRRRQRNSQGPGQPRPCLPHCGPARAACWYAPDRPRLGVDLARLAGLAPPA
jgi:hypothetical protein